jgi:hypothetical protein
MQDDRFTWELDDLEITPPKKQKAPVVHGHLVDNATHGINRDPTAGQKDAGNYRKGHINVQGIDVSIETRRGSLRRGVDANGDEWQCQLPAHYGYMRRSTGADGEQVDVYVGPDPQAPNAWIIDQVDTDTGEFDEHKVMLGFRDQESALRAYTGAFSDGKGKDRIGAVTQVTVSQLKSWLKGDTTTALGDLGKAFNPDQERDERGRWTSSGGVGADAQTKDLYKNQVAAKTSPERQAQMKAAMNAVSKESVWVAVTPGVLDKIVTDGRMKTAAETNKSNGHYDAESRAAFEDKYFGKSGDTIYGFMSNDGQATKAGMVYPSRGEPHQEDDVHQYGTARIQLKDDVRDRTSITAGDSWDYNKATVTQPESPIVQTLPSALNNPSHQSILATAGDKYYETMSDPHTRLDYVEAQVHGGVKVSDIAKVHFYGKEPSAALQKKLAKANIPWEMKQYA